MGFYRCTGGNSNNEKEEYFQKRVREILGNSITLSYSAVSTNGSPGNNILSWSINATGSGFDKIASLLRAAGYDVSGTGNFAYSWQNTERRDTRTITVLSGK